MIITADQREGSPPINEAAILRSTQSDANELFFGMIDVQSWDVVQVEEDTLVRLAEYAYAYLFHHGSQDEMEAAKKLFADLGIPFDGED